jgi:hypothetical protein
MSVKEEIYLTPEKYKDNKIGKNDKFAGVFELVYTTEDRVSKMV